MLVAGNFFVALSNSVESEEFEIQASLSGMYYKLCSCCVQANSSLVLAKVLLVMIIAFRYAPIGSAGTDESAS